MDEFSAGCEFLEIAFRGTDSIRLVPEKVGAIGFRLLETERGLPRSLLAGGRPRRGTLSTTHTLSYSQPAPPEQFRSRWSI